MKKLLKRIAPWALALTLLPACDSGFQELNQDPTEANEIAPEFLFSTVELGAAQTRYEAWRVNLIYGSAMVQRLAQTWWAGDKYTFNEDWSTALWNVAYSGNGTNWRAQLKHLTDMLAIVANDPNTVNQQAAGRILRVFIFSRLTDVYGDLPYFDAGKGFIDQYYTPKYEAQSAVIDDMLKELEEAVASFDASKPTFGSADLIYGGDIGRWQKFGNSLMLRIALRLVKADPAKAQQWAQKTVARGVMESNDDFAMIQQDSGPSTGPAGVNSNANSKVFSVDNPKLTDTFVNWMKAANDPRLTIYGAVLKDGQVITDPAVQKGMPNGQDANTIQSDPSWSGSFDDYSQPYPMLRDLDDPIFFQTYAEVAFMRAEAGLRGWTGDDPATFYAKGVRAAMHYLTLYDANGGADISDADIDAYLTANPYDPSRAMEQINTQYWAAVFLNGIEAWCNWRRTGYPLLSPVNWPGNVTNGTIPRRMTYPTSEEILNADNFKEVLSLQGSNEFTTHVWWDK